MKVVIDPTIEERLTDDAIYIENMVTAEAIDRGLSVGAPKIYVWWEQKGTKFACFASQIFPNVPCKEYHLNDPDGPYQ